MPRSSRLIFVVHPLQTEAVTYVICAASLMAFCFLATLDLVLLADAAPQHRFARLAAIVTCAVGMTAKPIMVTAPRGLVDVGWVLVPPTSAARLRDDAAARGAAPLAADLGLVATWLC
jgi:hypothetical protein